MSNIAEYRYMAILEIEKGEFKINLSIVAVQKRRVDGF